eukprot:3352049-Rhodomonas_salina.1
MGARSSVLSRCSAFVANSRCWLLVTKSGRHERYVNPFPSSLVGNLILSCPSFRALSTMYDRLLCMKS